MFLKCWIFLWAAVMLSAQRISRPEHRIVGGRQISIADAPWQVAVLSRVTICGGTIYNERIILTAAHCLHRLRAQDISVRAGSSLWKSGGQIVNATKIISHHKYKFLEGDDPYDIGVIVLKTPLELGETVKTIPLAEETPKVGTEALVTGWGEIHLFFGATRHLRGVNVTIEDHMKCKLALANEHKVVTQDMICAAAPGKDACRGDSGGPLVDIRRGELIGLVSWGEGCADSRYPGIYADVAFFKDWIRQVVFNSTL